MATRDSEPQCVLCGKELIRLPNGKCSNCDKEFIKLLADLEEKGFELDANNRTKPTIPDQPDGLFSKLRELDRKIVKAINQFVGSTFLIYTYISLVVHYPLHNDSSWCDIDLQAPCDLYLFGGPLELVVFHSDFSGPFGIFWLGDYFVPIFATLLLPTWLYLFFGDKIAEIFER